MNINAVRLIYFSPTGTTKKILEAIAQGLQIPAVSRVDLTPPDAIIREIPEVRDEIAIMGAPVYNGRLPTDAVLRLRRIKGNNTPAAVVVMYGNRAYEDALLELRDLASGAGFKTIAAGSFIGEHSYSSGAAPIAAGRPDLKDLETAREFGKMVRKKMENTRVLDSLVHVPGNFPYKEVKGLSNISPITEELACNKCEECLSVCPTGAITLRDKVVTDPALCIRCCACVKICPAGARKMEDQRIVQVAKQLSINCHDRKEPEIYIN